MGKKIQYNGINHLAIYPGEGKIFEDGHTAKGTSP